MLDLAASVLALTALLSYLNHRFVRLPTMIGVMSIALLISVIALLLDAVGIDLPRTYESSFLESVDFSEVLMEGMLSVLLFAGALHVERPARRHFGRAGIVAAAYGRTRHGADADLPDRRVFHPRTRTQHWPRGAPCGAL